MVTPYRELFATPNTKGFALVGILARIPSNDEHRHHNHAVITAWHRATGQRAECSHGSFGVSHPTTKCVTDVGCSLESLAPECAWLPVLNVT
ncbi:Uncharacterised protein [Yersinia pseudotuberculosis]|uniref:Uncharacterized protein n=1 Tax=Yersinia pseudotuberculosis TaxID=633 RepID=A0A380Q603_YERPU|nr:Uncharacterised protein [Yersinia pseudotuberculosis]SUP81208.1 Uncharacterised protein [Yersinia pseudotuberculosis]